MSPFNENKVAAKESVDKFEETTLEAPLFINNNTTTTTVTTVSKTTVVKRKRKDSSKSHNTLRRAVSDYFNSKKDKDEDSQLQEKTELQDVAESEENASKGLKESSKEREETEIENKEAEKEKEDINRRISTLSRNSNVFDSSVFISKQNEGRKVKSGLRLSTSFNNSLNITGGIQSPQTLKKSVSENKISTLELTEPVEVPLLDIIMKAQHRHIEQLKEEQLRKENVIVEDVQDLIEKDVWRDEEKSLGNLEFNLAQMIDF
eukprot:Awhi_evm1s10794